MKDKLMFFMLNCSHDYLFQDDIAKDVAPDTPEAVAVNTETIHVDTLDHILDQLKLETDNVPDKSTDTFNDYFPGIQMYVRTSFFGNPVKKIIMRN